MIELIVPRLAHLLILSWDKKNNSSQYIFD